MKPWPVQTVVFAPIENSHTGAGTRGIPLKGPNLIQFLFRINSEADRLFEHRVKLDQQNYKTVKCF